MSSAESLAHLNPVSICSIHSIYRQNIKPSEDQPVHGLVHRLVHRLVHASAPEVFRRCRTRRLRKAGRGHVGHLCLCTWRGDKIGHHVKISAG